MEKIISSLGLDTTIIIPTYQRLDKLKIALESCFEQTLPPKQIIIGDDSKDDITENWYRQNNGNWSVPVVYMHNNPSLGQAANVENLIQSVNTTLLLLLHDDDLLLPNALKDLTDALSSNTGVDVAFGKQYLINELGEIDYADSESLNNLFFRTEAFAGRSLDSLEVLLRQQLPSNSFLIKTDLAKEVHYGEKAKAGNGVDFHFCYKLGIERVNCLYIDKYVSNYRISNDGISRISDSGYFAFKLISILDINESNFLTLKEIFLKKKAPIAIVQAKAKGLKKQAWNIYFSKYHFWKILSLGGIRRGLLLLFNR